MRSDNIVIIGSGAAGMMAALVLTENKIPCTILEKGDHIGTSNAARAGGPALADTELQKKEGCTVGREQLFHHMFRFARGTVNGDLLRNIVEEGPTAEKLLTENGIEMEVMQDMYGTGFRARHLFKTRGRERWQKLQEKLESQGGRIVFHTCAKEILMEDGRISGVLAYDTKDAAERKYDACAVVVASGGYLGSEEKIRSHFGRVHVGALGNRLSDGGGQDMILKAGGTLENNWGICSNEFGGFNHKSSRPTAYEMRYAVSGCLLVDRHGRRFMNEQYLSDEPLSVGGNIALREGKYYAVMDSESFEGMTHADTLYSFYGCPSDWYAGKTTHNHKLPGKPDLNKAMQEGWALVCNTLEEAEKIWGLSELTETVKEYNVCCSRMRDDRFGKAGYLLKPVLRSPYYLFEYEPSGWCTLGGVRTDAYCRVLSPDQQVIPGLYAGGVDNGSCYCVPYYDNEGACLGVALCSGIVAARQIIKEVRYE